MAAIAAQVAEMRARPSLEPSAPMNVRGTLQELGAIENMVLELGEEVVKVTRRATGVERGKLSELNSRLRLALEDLGPARASLQAMERETLPARIEIARSGFAAALRVIGEDLVGAL